MRHKKLLGLVLLMLPAFVFADDISFDRLQTVARMLERHDVAVNPNILSSSAVLLSPQRALVSRSIAGPAAEGFMVRFVSAEIRELARQNQPLPSAQFDFLRRISGMKLRFVRNMSGGAFVLNFPEPLPWEQAEKVVALLNQQPEIEFVALNLRLQPKLTPNDPLFGQQWALASPARYWGGMNMEAAWDISKGGETTVAVIDTGITSHPEFNDRVLPGYDFISSITIANDGNGRDSDPSDPGDWVSAGECKRGQPAEDSSWHGTHVAGIIAAQGNNAEGVAGVNWNTRILPVRVLGKCGGLISDVVDGMRWAAGLPVPGVAANPYPVQVLNLSLGVSVPEGCSGVIGTPFLEAINEIKLKNVAIIVAAGNDAEEAAYSVPAACPGVIVVSAINQNGYLASYSNYSFRNIIDIAAPGGDWGAEIYSTFNSGTKGPVSPTYKVANGTSMAVPHVAGLAALVNSVNPGLPAKLAGTLMKATSRPFPSDSDCARHWPLCGIGILDGYNTLQGALALRAYLLVTEFYNPDVNLYFRTGNETETNGLIEGVSGRWNDTGDYFWAWGDNSQGALPVCRFYGTPGIGPNSHFYTVDQRECETVKTLRGWTYEGTAFYMKGLDSDGSGRCPKGSIPVYRYYNAKQVNHRFATHLNDRAAMAAAGWQLEGVAMCAPEM